jgi:nitrite reductase/ring-hydroxylating ferredoxin subunit
VTIFRHRGHLTAIDSVCHHAGGPLTLGPLQDIEDLGSTCSMNTNSTYLLISSL